MSKRTYRLVIVDVELNDEVFEHYFDYENGKIKFLPATNKIAKAVKEHAAAESEFDPQKPECHKEYCDEYE